MLNLPYTWPDVWYETTQPGMAIVRVWTTPDKSKGKPVVRVNWHEYSHQYCWTLWKNLKPELSVQGDQWADNCEFVLWQNWWVGVVCPRTDNYAMVCCLLADKNLHAHTVAWVEPRANHPASGIWFMAIITWCK